MGESYGVTSVFFDPWVKPKYYYDMLLQLPLLFDRIYVYYPSDRWIDARPQRESFNYRTELLYWLRDGAIVPVVKGNYPFDNHIGEARLANDLPTDDFRNELRRLRRERENSWVIFPADATEQGRENARQIIRDLGGSKDLSQELRVQLDTETIPELAYYYSGAVHATQEDALVETIGTYENNDWMRADRNLGEYVLPPLMAYQYQALRNIRGQTQAAGVNHYAAASLALDAISKQPTMLLDHDVVKNWRDMGLHRVLRHFLANEAKSIDAGNQQIEGTGRSFQEMVRQLRARWPVALADDLINKGLLAEVMGGAFGGLTGFVSSGYQGYGAVVGAVGGSLTGYGGKQAIKLGVKRIRWDGLLERLTNVFGSTPRSVERFVLGFGEVTVFGSKD